MDVAVCNALRGRLDDGTHRIFLSYDIACKYSVNFLARVQDGAVTLLEHDKAQLRAALRFLVPKFHLAGHEPTCADRYSFDFEVGVGRMSGELVETPWASLNRLKSSTRPMTAAARHDTLNHQVAFWNSEKISKICM